MELCLTAAFVPEAGYHLVQPFSFRNFLICALGILVLLMLLQGCSAADVTLMLLQEKKCRDAVLLMLMPSKFYSARITWTLFATFTCWSLFGECQRIRVELSEKMGLRQRKNG